MKIMQYIPKSVVKTVAPRALKVQKHAPVILFGAGVVGSVTATVLACKATLQLDPILTEAQIMLEKIDAAESETYTEELKSKHKAAVRVKTGLNIIKLYGPAFIVGAASIASLTGSHYIMSKRQAGLMAAYAALDKGFREYQERVREELGAEKEEHLRRGFVSEKFKNDEGKTVSHTRIDPNGYSVYAKLFHRDTTKEWTNDPRTNFLVLKSKQNHANDMLHYRGHMFLNDVYDLLGIERTPEGQVVGWLSQGNGDGFIDLGIFNAAKDSVRDFVNGHENAVWLDFNVDGVIWDKI